MRIAILGGTGDEGLGLAARFAAAGDEVVIGSRSAERAAAAAQELSEKVDGGKISGQDNLAASTWAEAVFLSVPFEGLAPTLDTIGGVIGGKLLIDLVVPLFREKGVFLSKVPEEGSVGEFIAARVPDARIVSAFKNQSAHELLDLTKPVLGDVMLCGADAEAKDEVAAMVKRIPDLRPVDVGPLGVSRHLEAVTALLLNINRKHKAHATVQILGI